MRHPFTSLAIAVVLCAAPSIAADAPPQSLPGGLQRVENAKVDLAYVLPGTDWSKYKTIQLRELAIPAEVRNAAPPGTTTSFRESYVLRDKDVLAIQKAYAEVTKDELAKGGFTFVEAPGPDTLIIVPKIIDIKLNAPIEESRASYSGRGRTYTKGVGSIAIAAGLADGATGKVIAEAADRNYSADVWGINNSATNMGEARQAFRSWAKLLRNRLTEARGQTN
jgi:hypothetical protein